MKTHKVNFEVEIPDWVKWIAQDKDGWWYGFERQPQRHMDSWGTAGHEILLANGPKPENWKEELYQFSY